MAETEKKAKGMNQNYDIIVLVALFVIVLLASYFFFSKQLREFDVKGLKVLAKSDPAVEFKEILRNDKIIMKEYLYPNEDERNSYVGLVAGEIAGAFSIFNRSIIAYGYVPEETDPKKQYINCVEKTNFCSSEKIVVQISDCNCVKLEDGIIYVLYEKERLKEDPLRVRLRGILGGILNEIEIERKGGKKN